MKKFSYNPTVSLGILVQQMIGVLGLLISNVIAILFFWGTGNVEPSSNLNFINDPRSTLVCVGFWSLVIGWTTSLGLINAYPTIWLDESGITISAFLFFKIRIHWTDVVDINIGGVRFGHDLVRARRITIFHRIYGWLYTHTIYPSFIIRKDIKEREHLIREIQQRIQKSV
jgi:hypothetical protein